MNAPMRSHDSIRNLQQQQQAHDLKSHKDILCLPVQDRLRHMVLHFAKYVGRLVNGGTQLGATSFERTVVDTFIIALATANALNVNLGAFCTAPQSEGEQGSLEAIQTKFSIALAIQTGRMAKACEALDHVERFNIREELEAGVTAICSYCLAAASGANIRLPEAVTARWREIETKDAL